MLAPPAVSPVAPLLSKTIRPRVRGGLEVGWLSWTALREFEGQSNGYDPRSLFLALLRDRRFLGVAGVQDHRQEAGPGLAARVPGHPVHRSRRLVERIPGLV